MKLGIDKKEKKKEKKAGKLEKAMEALSNNSG